MADEGKIIELLKKHGFDKPDKDDKNNLVAFPKPISKYRLVLEAPNQSIEEYYYWIIGHFRDDWGYNVDKIKDIFAAAEASAMFGVTQQRATLQQDQVSKYLKFCADLTKDLFQIVREIRVLDERLAYYENTGIMVNEKGEIGYDTGKEKDPESSEITLKGIWVDLVEGGSKSASSVYGLARDVGFTILPDLFFKTRIKEGESVDEIVNNLPFNRKVLEVLKRKLNQFYEWKRRTYRELKTRRLFILKSVRQTYTSIKLYIDWIKPYLSQIRRLRGEERTWDEDLIGAFEGSLIEIETMAWSKVSGNKKYKPIIIVNWDHRTKPAMSFQSDYQRGPIHIGRTIITMRAYAWSDEQIQKYKEMRSDEDMEIISSIDDSIKAAVDALGDELKKYLNEAGEKIDYKKVEEEKSQEGGLLDPFIAIFKGIDEIISVFLPKKKKEKEKGEIKLNKFNEKAEIKAAKGVSLNVMWQTYKNLKKSHGLIAW